ncbi:MAG: transglycosylase domain-containing protein [Bacilli bacterium]
MKRKLPELYQKLRENEQLKRLMIRSLQISLLGTALFILIALIIALTYKDDVLSMMNEASEKVENTTENTFKNKEETVIFDRDGNVIATVAPHDYDYIEIENVPKTVQDATIAIEDIRFYEHKGYDLKAILRAGVELVKNKGAITQGGSTITQQLVKLEFLSLEKTYKRKIMEILIAAKLEKKFDKEQILEFYLNNINYANGAYGIETAAKTYFNKSVKDLTLSEIAFLTAIPNNPSKYNPVHHMENTLKRRDLILKKMLEYEMIDEKQYSKAISEEIKLNMPEKIMEPETYEVSFALSSAAKIMMEKEGFKFQYWFDSHAEREKYMKDYNERFLEWNQKIRNGGYEIYTTIDSQKQKLLQETINTHLAPFTSKNPETGIFEMQGSAVTIENKTGDVLAIVGGRTQEDVPNSYNRAFLSYRQPGSTIKPIIVYTPVFQGNRLASSVMNDQKMDNGPQNATGTYAGYMTLREAVARSVNTIPYQLGMEMGPKKMLAYLRKMEFSGLVPEDDHVGIAYGGFTYGTNTLEMASAYATLANDGNFIKPTGIEKIVDIVHDEVLYQNERKTKKIYDAGAANLMLEILKDVVNQPNGTAYGFGLSGMTTAAKTGTTNDYHDKWFAGVTPYHSTVVWTGYDIPKPMGPNYDPSRHIWKEYSEQIHKGLKDIGFSQKRLAWMYKNPSTGEVSKEARSGWIKELVPEIFYEIQIAHQMDGKKLLVKQEKIKREKAAKAVPVSKEATTESQGNTPPEHPPEAEKTSSSNAPSNGASNHGGSNPSNPPKNEGAQHNQPAPNGNTETKPPEEAEPIEEEKPAEEEKPVVVEDAVPINEAPAEEKKMEVQMN